jgi:hypothetical protein
MINKSSSAMRSFGLEGINKIFTYFDSSTVVVLERIKVDRKGLKFIIKNNT